MSEEEAHGGFYGWTLDCASLAFSLCLFLVSSVNLGDNGVLCAWLAQRGLADDASDCEKRLTETRGRRQNNGDGAIVL
jgi:hypothetical protein